MHTPNVIKPAAITIKWILTTVCYSICKVQNPSRLIMEMQNMSKEWGLIWGDHQKLQEMWQIKFNKCNCEWHSVEKWSRVGKKRGQWRGNNCKPRHWSWHGVHHYTPNSMLTDAVWQRKSICLSLNTTILLRDMQALKTLGQLTLRKIKAHNIQISVYQACFPQQIHGMKHHVLLCNKNSSTYPRCSVSNCGNSNSAIFRAEKTPSLVKEGWMRTSCNLQTEKFVKTLN